MNLGGWCSWCRSKTSRYSFRPVLARRNIFHLLWQLSYLEPRGSEKKQCVIKNYGFTIWFLKAIKYGAINCGGRSLFTLETRKYKEMLFFFIDSVYAKYVWKCIEASKWTNMLFVIIFVSPKVLLGFGDTDIELFIFMS